MLSAIVALGLTRRSIVLLTLLVFVGCGCIAFTMLNIEAYPNPAPVNLEIIAQAPGLSAEEMERYYTIPIEIGLYANPCMDNIHPTSFYGLSFVRVTFKAASTITSAIRGGAEPAAERHVARKPAAVDSSIEPSR